jgi:hypothetical protein
MQVWPCAMKLFNESNSSMIWKHANLDEMEAQLFYERDCTKSLRVR